MKILLFGDAHCCKRSSIINKFGSKYSARLENLIQTFSWIKEQALVNNCDMVIGLGDLFDASQLSDMEITAAKELPFAELPTYLLVGNHEASSQDLVYSSTKLLEGPNCTIVSEPFSLFIGNTELCFLPYITESDRKPIIEYFKNKKAGSKRVILSHNDMKGISYGLVVSVVGFETADIESNCDLYINAHIHNGQRITNKIYNIGNITGQNFSEDAFKYSHNIIILDTDTLHYELIENPYAYNFYKLQVNTEADLSVFNTLKNNAVVSIKCEQQLIEKTKHVLSELSDKIIDSRIILVRNIESVDSSTTELDLSVDHLARFIECCKASIEDSKLLEEELSEICK